MSETEQQARLAALNARRRGKAPPAMDEAPTTEPPPAVERRAVTVGIPSTARICATAASTVSFAAMVVAMGPLVTEVGRENDFTPEDIVADTMTTPADTLTIPTAPSATIALAQQQQPSPANLAVGSSTTTPAQQSLAPAAEATTAPTSAPTTAAPPTTGAPTTAAPVTQPPPPPPTAAPTTAVPAPATAPPPPKSGASG